MWISPTYLPAPSIEKKIKNCVTSDNCTSEFTLNPAAAPFVPGSKHTSDLNSEVSTVTHSNSSQAVDPTSKNASEQSKSSNSLAAKDPFF